MLVLSCSLHFFPSSHSLRTLPLLLTTQNILRVSVLRLQLFLRPPLMAKAKACLPPRVDEKEAQIMSA